MCVGLSEMASTKEKRVRCANYTPDETEALLGLVEKYKHILECKYTDTVSISQKEKTWNTVADEFNSSKGTSRSGKMLRSKWDALKKATKIEYSKIKDSAKHTGGGAGAGFKLAGLGERVLGIVGIGITGTNNAYDSDNIELLYIDDVHDGPTENVQILNNESLEENTWRNWSPASLRQPLAPALQVQFAREAVSTEEFREIQKSVTIDSQKKVEYQEKQTEAILEQPDTEIEVNKEQDKEITEAVRNKRTPNKNVTPKLHKKRVTSKEREYNAYEALALKKTKLVELQIESLLEESKERKEKHDFEMKMLQETFAEERKQRNEKHELEMQILKEKLIKK